jgi:cysteine-rich repeat protein
MINPVCGDRVVSRATKETCDDGNKVNGDGCSSQCKIERNFRTTAIPTTTSIAVDSDTDVTYTVQKPTKDIDVLVAPYLNANEKIFL